MRPRIAALFCLPAAGCLQLTSSDDGGAGVIGSTSSDVIDAAPPVDAGFNCITPLSGVELCEQITGCPGVDVNQGALPNCGFRVGGLATLDLECDCGGALCPIGVPETCANAATLLTGQTTFDVCEQASLGLCANTGGVVSDGGNAGGAAGCNSVCESECAGAPACIQLCGC
jgi:hypothetical protein